MPLKFKMADRVVIDQSHKKNFLRLSWAHLILQLHQMYSRTFLEFLILWVYDETQNLSL